MIKTAMSLGVAGMLAFVVPAMAVDAPAPQNPQAQEPPNQGVQFQAVATQQALLAAPMAGIVDDLPLRDGQSFHKDDLLASFDCGVQRATLDHAVAEQQKHAGLVTIQNRLRQLKSYSEADMRTAQAELQAANADRRLAQANVAHCTVQAPFDGVVSGVSAHAHQFLQLGAPLLSSVNPGSVELDMVAPEALLPKIQPGAEFSVMLAGHTQKVRARVIRLSPVIDPVSRTVRVYAVPEEDAAAFLPGMTGEVVFP
ncbi:efflux RND transporter periplasmic adaptor subunit [Novacetimonas sp. GS1]|uniref:efflux RND transporter periplasmic adaptor subunit n=1 Tax=Novacetimonas sp. GS1 TaxID=3119990 RepID=UPI002FCCD145